MAKTSVILFLLLAVNLVSFAQEDSVIIEREVVVEQKDTTLIKSYATRYNPRKALLYAAILPGLGQIYNKKYWKLPLVYGGFVAIGYGLNFYDGLYKEYKHELFINLEQGIGENEIREGTPTTTRGYRVAVDRAKRERDFMIILMGGMYILQIIDAHVDAHLKEFDLNPNLRVSIEPMMEQNSLIGRQTGVALIIRF
ncbi:MAG TPA: DUF5683 domain-containing protein [Ohtaekwangia sp.]|nr:DUF5683 domain-containing protein [Ohtaekwangia sp.]